MKGMSASVSKKRKMMLPVLGKKFEMVIASIVEITT
jgi:hypothetical protein